MRLLGVALLVLGLVATVLGTFSGVNALFSWNGRHPIDVRTLADGASTQTLVPDPGVRYTLSIEVAFDRTDLPKRDNAVVVEAKMPLVVRVRDAAGTSLAEATGWLDPNEPPNVLYGQAARESMRGPMPELVVARLIGPFVAASPAPLAVEINVGPDRVGTAQVTARRLVIHDDALPRSIKSALTVAGVGAVAFLAGLGITAVGWLTRRRRRGGIPLRDSV